MTVPIGPLEFVLGGLVPLAAAAVAFAVAWRLSRRAGAAWSAGTVVGYAAGTLALEANNSSLSSAGMRFVQTTQSHDWLTLLALAATVPALVAAIAKRHWLEAALAAPLCVVATLVLLSIKYRAAEQRREAGFGDDTFTPRDAALVVAGIAAAIFVAWSLWRRAEGAPLAKTRSLLAIVAATGAAMTAALTGALGYGQALGSLAAALGGCASVAWLVRERSGPEAARGPALMIFGGVVFAAVCYSSLLPWQAAVLAAAFTLPIGWLPGASRLRPAAEGALRTALCMIPLTIVVWRAFDEFQANEQQSEEYDYEYESM